MAPKNKFLNTQSSIAVNNEATSASDLSTTDNELETGSENQESKSSIDEDAFVNSVNDAEEIETGIKDNQEISD
jgi:hypothetical protein